MCIKVINKNPEMDKKCEIKKIYMAIYRYSNNADIDPYSLYKAINYFSN